MQPLLPAGTSFPKFKQTFAKETEEEKQKRHQQTNLFRFRLYRFDAPCIQKRNVLNERTSKVYFPSLVISRLKLLHLWFWISDL